MNFQFVSWGLIAFQLFWFALVPLVGAWFGYCAFTGVQRKEPISVLSLVFMSLVSTMAAIAMAEQAFWPPFLGLLLATAGGYFYAGRQLSKAA